MPWITKAAGIRRFQDANTGLSKRHIRTRIAKLRTKQDGSRHKIHTVELDALIEKESGVPKVLPFANGVKNGRRQKALLRIAEYGI